MSEARPSDEPVRSARPPRAVRVVAWLTTFLGAWGLVEEVVRGSGRLSTNWLNLAIGLAYLIAGIGLIRGRLWLTSQPSRYGPLRSSGEGGISSSKEPSGKRRARSAWA
jgi:hypothetical protein